MSATYWNFLLNCILIIFFLFDSFKLCCLFFFTYFTTPFYRTQFNSSFSRIFLAIFPKLFSMSLRLIAIFNLYLSVYLFFTRSVFLFTTFYYSVIYHIRFCFAHFQQYIFILKCKFLCILFICYFFERFILNSSSAFVSEYFLRLLLFVFFISFLKLIFHLIVIFFPTSDIFHIHSSLFYLFLLFARITFHILLYIPVDISFHISFISCLYSQ